MSVARGYAYAGIGSRATPSDTLAKMTAFARFIEARDGAILRSGGAQGADSAFATGATSAEIYLPWRGFAQAKSTHSVMDEPTGWAYKIAEQYHPNWEYLRPSVRRLHARNAHIILGADLESPVMFVMCWTPGGRVVGGTGLGLRIAKAYDVPVINLGDINENNQSRASTSVDQRVLQP